MASKAFPAKGNVLGEKAEQDERNLLCWGGLHFKWDVDLGLTSWHLSKDLKEEKE